MYTSAHHSVYRDSVTIPIHPEPRHEEEGISISVEDWGNLSHPNEDLDNTSWTQHYINRVDGHSPSNNYTSLPPSPTQLISQSFSTLDIANQNGPSSPVAINSTETWSPSSTIEQIDAINDFSTYRNDIIVPGDNLNGEIHPGMDDKELGSLLFGDTQNNLSYDQLNVESNDSTKMMPSFPFSGDLLDSPSVEQLSSEGRSPIQTNVPIQYHNQTQFMPVPIMNMHPHSSPASPHMHHININTNNLPFSPIESLSLSPHLAVPDNQWQYRRHSSGSSSADADRDEFRRSFFKPLSHPTSYQSGPNFSHELPETVYKVDEEQSLFIHEADMPRRRTFSGRSSARSPSATRKSNSLRGRPPTVHSRASSRQSSPYSGARSTSASARSNNIPLPEVHSPTEPFFSIRDRLLQIYDLVGRSSAISDADEEEVERLLLKHAPQILSFEPVISEADASTDATSAAAERRRKANPDRKLLRCFLCRKELTEKHNFDRHFRAHFGIKKFRCDACTMRFTTSSDLSRHGPACKGSRARR